MRGAVDFNMTTATVTIYGASDDLIEVDGKIREEFSSYHQDEPQFLGFSDGTVLSIQYTDEGVWRITPVFHGTASYDKVKEAASADDEDYSDVVTLTETVHALTWVVYGREMAKAK